MKNCVSCGKENLDEAVFCSGCGSPLAQAPEAQAAAPEETAAPAVTEEPVVETAPVTAGEPAPQAAPAQSADAYAYTAPAAPAAPTESNKATLWLILNIVATVLCCLMNIFSIIGIIFAGIGMSSYNKGDYEDMKKKSKIAMILFIVGIAGGVLTLILSLAGLFALPIISSIGY